MKQLRTKLLKSRLFKGAIGSLGLKIAATGFAFITSVVLARLLGSEGLGAYSYILSWIGLLSIPAVLGLDYLLVKEIAIANNRQNWGLLRGLLQWTNGIVILVSSAIAIAAGVAFYLLDTEASLHLPFYLALGTLPLNALGSIRMGAMKGLKRVVIGTIPEALISPLLFLVLIAASYWVWGSQVDVSLVMGFKVLVSLVTFAVGTLWLTRLVPAEVVKATPVRKDRIWLRSSFPFMLFGSMQLINAKCDVLMLGAIQGAAAVGIYSVVRYGTSFIVFVQGAVNSVLSPDIAALVDEGRTADLQKIISKSSAVVFAASLAIGLILIVFSTPILSLFGKEFVGGRDALIILSIGQLVNAAVGPVGKLLIVGGYENHTAISVAASGAINILLNALLIPQWGVNGAAIATATSIALVNLVNLYLVRQRLGIDSAAWSILNPRNL